MKLKHPDPTGFFTFLQNHVRMLYGDPQSTHGRACHPTRKGPGRRAPLKADRVHPAGTKLMRRFIRTSGKESSHWRDGYASLTGKQYGAVDLP